MQSLTSLARIQNISSLGSFVSGLALPTAGLLQWLFKDANTSTQAVDKVGTRAGTVFAGRCYNFDGVNDKITIVTANNTIEEVSAIDMNGDVIPLTLDYVTDRYEIIHEAEVDGHVFNIKCWAFGFTPTEAQQKAVTLADSGGQANLFAWFKCDEGDGATAFDSSGNENNGTITNATLSTFHATNVGVGYSWLNQVGYSEGTGANAGVEIPRNESDITKDVLGNDLQHVGLVKLNADFKDSNCATLDGVDDYGITTHFNLNGASSYKLSGYVQDGASGNTMIIDTRDAAGDGAFLGSIANTLRFTHNADSVSTSLAPASYNNKLIEAQWTGTTLNLYVGGVLVGTTPSTSTISLTSGKTTIGARNFSTLAQTFTGKIYSIKLEKNGVTTEFPLAEGTGATSYAREDDTKYITWTNTTEATFWGTKQDVYHSNIIDGFTFAKYLDGSTDQVAIASGGSWLEEVGDYFEFDLWNEGGASLMGFKVTSSNTGLYLRGTGIHSVYIGGTNNTVSGEFTNLEDVRKVRLTRTASTIVTLDTTFKDGTTDSIDFTTSDFGGVTLSRMGNLFGGSPVGGFIQIDNNGTLYNQANNYENITFDSSVTNIRYPFMISGAYTNPAVTGGHNGAETGRQAPKAPSLYLCDVNNYLYDSSGEPNTILYSDHQANVDSANKLFMDISQDNRHVNFVAYESVQSGSTLDKINKFLNIT